MIRPDIINPSLFSQEYFETIIPVVYPGAKVKDIVPFSCPNLQDISKKCIYYGFAKPQYTQSGVDFILENKIQVWQRDQMHWLNERGQDLVLFDQTAFDENGGIGDPVSFIGFKATVDFALEPQDTSTPVFTGEVSMKVLKVVKVNNFLLYLVGGTAGHLLQTPFGDTSSLAGGSLEWVESDIGLGTFTGIPFHVTPSDGSGASGTPVFIDNDGLLRPFDYVKNGSVYTFSHRPNKLYQGVYEPAVITIRLYNSLNVLQATKVLTDPAAETPGMGDSFDVTGFTGNGSYFKINFGYKHLGETFTAPDPHFFTINIP